MLPRICSKMSTQIYVNFAGTYHNMSPSGRVLYHFIFVAMLLIWSTTICSAGINFCRNSTEGHRLNATVYRNVFSMSDIDCILLCVVDPCCRGTNYRKVFDGEENCEILHEVQTDLCDVELKKDENYNYLKLNQPMREFDCQSCSPCENGGICDDATKQCSCLSGFLGKKCEKAKNKSCADHYARGSRHDGIYTIDPDCQGAFQVRCDMTTDGGGWTIFQRRVDGSVDFFLNWTDYQQGFGNLEGDFWLGLDKIHRLSQSGQNVLRIDLEDFANEKRYANYSSFAVASEAEKYQLTVDGYSGDAHNSMVAHNGMKFSTKDQDNDLVPEDSRSCAVAYTGAWWYYDCHACNLNGQYLNGQTDQIAKGVTWREWHGQGYSLRKTEMKTRSGPSSQ